MTEGKMANTLSVMTNVLRNVVSKQRIRYKEKGFNLDLAYICDNIIAMGYPADNLESIYRNRLEDVYKFLEEIHPDHYKIYNLCLERSYDINKFHGRVSVYPFEDHNPPTIELIQKFCNDVDIWLKADSMNVAAVHCKAGKGRTGTMICCYLLFSRQQSTAEDALAYYDEKRTKDRKGVTIPSQRRYVQYFSTLIRSGLKYEKRHLEICEIRFSEASILSSQGIVNCSISTLQDISSAVKIEPLQNTTIDFRKSYTLDIKNSPLPICGDIKVELFHKTSRKKIFHFWFNTFFVYDCSKVIDGEGGKLAYTLNKSEIDDAHKDKEHKCFPEDFKVQLVFSCQGCGDISPTIPNNKAKSTPKTKCTPSDYILPQYNINSKLNYAFDQKRSSSVSLSSLDEPGVKCDQLHTRKSRCDNLEAVYIPDMNNRSVEVNQLRTYGQNNIFSVASSSIDNQKDSVITAVNSTRSLENYQPSMNIKRNLNSCKNNSSYKQENHNSQNSSISSHSSCSATGDKDEDWESGESTYL